MTFVGVGFRKIKVKIKIKIKQNTFLNSSRSLKMREKDSKVIVEKRKGKYSIDLRHSFNLVKINCEI